MYRYIRKKYIYSVVFFVLLIGCGKHLSKGMYSENKNAKGLKMTIGEYEENNNIDNTTNNRNIKTLTLGTEDVKQEAEYSITQDIDNNNSLYSSSSGYCSDGTESKFKICKDKYCKRLGKNFSRCCTCSIAWCYCKSYKDRKYWLNHTKIVCIDNSNCVKKNLYLLIKQYDSAMLALCCCVAFDSDSLCINARCCKSIKKHFDSMSIEVDRDLLRDSLIRDLHSQISTFLLVIKFLYMCLFLIDYSLDLVESDMLFLIGVVIFSFCILMWLCNLRSCFFPSLYKRRIGDFYFNTENEQELYTRENSFLEEEIGDNILLR